MDNQNIHQELGSLLVEVGGVDSFTGAQAITVMKKIIGISQRGF